jgi:hypothetical protein
MPAITTAQPLSPLADLAPGAVCPLDRVAIVRGSDSEARQDGGFYAERRNGIHGAVDLNGSLGTPGIVNPLQAVRLPRAERIHYHLGQLQTRSTSTISGEALRSATDFCVGGGSPG